MNDLHFDTRGQLHLYHLNSNFIIDSGPRVQTEKTELIIYVKIMKYEHL